MTAADDIRATLTPLMAKTLAWWATDGTVRADVPAPVKTGLVRRGLAQWVPGDDLCPRLTVLGIEMQALVQSEQSTPVSERTDNP